MKHAEWHRAFKAATCAAGYALLQEQTAAVTERFRTIIKEQAPAMRDAVIEGFRFQNGDLERIAATQLLVVCGKLSKFASA